jgi:hypothetical protein
MRKRVCFSSVLALGVISGYGPSGVAEHRVIRFSTLSRISG